jgi:hypothetical protein
MFAKQQRPGTNQLQTYCSMQELRPPSNVLTAYLVLSHYLQRVVTLRARSGHTTYQEWSHYIQERSHYV